MPGQPAVAQTPGRKDFRDVMQNLSQEGASDRMLALAEDIRRQGRVVAERKDIMELKRYKKLIADFMHEAVQFAFEFSKKNLRDGRGRHRAYATIRRIDDALDDLTKKLLGDESETITLMASIDDINGMLIDLVI